MALVKRRIPVEQIDITAGTLKTRQLPLAVMAGLSLELDADLTLAATVLTQEDFLRNLIQKVEVVLNGQDTLISIPFDFLYYMNLLEFGVTPEITFDGTVGANRLENVHVYLPFELLNAVIPRDTLLDARSLSTCVLNIHWGTAAGMTTSTVTINSASLSILTKEFANIPESFPTARHEYSYDTILLDVAGTITYQLPTRGNNQYRRVWVMALDGSSPKVLSNSEITNLKVKARSFVYYDAPEDANRAEQTRIWGVAEQTGIYCIDFTDHGQMAGRVDARNLPELTIELTSAVTDGQAIIIAEKAIYAGGQTA